MTIFDMLEQSGVLTLLGMGVVFGFLVLLVIAVTIMGKIIRALGVENDAGTSAPKPAQPSSPAKTTAVAAAITAAVTEYHNSNSEK